MEQIQDFSQPFYIESWRIEPSLNRIVSNEGTRQVEPKIMQVLVYLAQQNGEVARRDETLDTVWADTVVGDEVLSRCISELRKVFNDNPRKPRIIETIPRVGYRLMVVPRVVTFEKDGWPDTPPVLDVAPLTSSTTPDATPPTRRWYGLGAAVLVLLATLIWRLEIISPALPPALRTTPVTSTTDAEFDPAISPNGTHVAYIWSGGDRGFLNLYVKVIGTETPLQLTNTPLYEWSPAWSPDGTEIAFARSGTGIMAIPVLGGPERKLITIGHARTDLDWSPRNDYIVYATKPTRDTPSTIFLLDLATLSAEPLTTPPNNLLGDTKPVFSPDGTQVAFIRALATGNDIHIVPIAGGTPQRITVDGLEISGVDWTSDGQALIYSSNRDGTMSLWRIAASGGTPERVPLGGGVEGNDPNVANNRLVFTQSFTETNIWRVVLDSAGAATEPSILIRSTRRDASPRFSPDGTRVAFMSTRSGSAEIWLADADGKNLTQLTRFEGPQTRNPRWSPDGTRLAFESHAEGYAGVYLTAIATGRTERLTDGSFIERLPIWSPDGQWIYFDSNRSGQWNIWKRPAAGGKAIQITQAGGSGGVVSADGTYLYYTKPSASGLWRTDLASGTETQIIDDLGWWNWGFWTIWSNDLYYLQRIDRMNRLIRYNLTTQTTAPLLNLPDNLIRRQPALTISPDGTTLLFSQIDYSYFDIMLAEPFE